MSSNSKACAYRTHRLCAAGLALWLAAGAAAAAGVSVRYDFSNPEASPFPSDRFTVPAWGNNTFKRVNLPKPDCTARPSDCADIDVINELDGFSTQPRISVPFTGAIDVGTVNSNTVFLVNLGDVQSGRGFGQRVGINQVLWDPATQTLVFESDQLLAEHSRYVLVITDGVKDAAGDPIERGRFGALHDADDAKGAPQLREGMEYRHALRSAMMTARHSSGSRQHIVAASLFTTQSTTSELAKIMRQIKRSTPAPANFAIGSGGARAFFPLASVASIQFNRQTGTAPAFTPSFLPTPALDIVPGAVGAIAYGQFDSADYTNADKIIPVTPTLTGRPQVQGSNTLTFQLFLPASAKPAGGYPVAIFGHGFGDSMYGAPWAVASVLASQGIATAAINVPGHAGGALGTLTVLRNGGAAPMVLPAGGRGIDQDGNGVIDSTEGVGAIGARSIVGNRDGLRQTAIDLMQLVRQIELGLDADGDGTADLNAQRIYYSGQSFGGIYGTIFTGIEPNLKASVPNVPGGSISEVARLGFFRFLTAVALATRTPQLLNLPPTPGVPVPFNLNFNENIPLRNQPAAVNNVPGAMAIQQLLERNEWVQQSGNPVSYAALIRKQPLPGSAPKPVIYQFAKGDTVVPNPTTTAILRAGDLAGRATYFRNDLAFAANPAVPKGPHTFLTNVSIPAAAPFAIAAQQQIAAFFASNGTLIIDPDGPGPLFEVPIVPPLPETVNFIP
jgi:hypothetical protein